MSLSLPRCGSLIGSLSLALAAAAPLAAHAQAPSVPKETARAVIQLWEFQSKLADTDFAYWMTDQLLMYAVHCAAAAQLPVPAALEKAKPRRAGAWTVPGNDLETQTACQGLAQANGYGLKPECAALTSTQPPFTMPRAGLPRDYVYLSRDAQDGERVTVGGYCQLVEREPLTRQFYAGPARVRLLGAPSVSSVQTASGPVRLRTSSVRFEVQGLFGDAHPVLAVWP